MRELSGMELGFVVGGDAGEAAVRGAIAGGGAGAWIASGLGYTGLAMAGAVGVGVVAGAFAVWGVYTLGNMVWDALSC